MAAPDQGPVLAVAICNHFNFNKDCATQFGLLGLGSVVTQVVANADVGGYDGQVSTFLSLASHLLTLDCRCCAKTSLGYALCHQPRL